MRFLRRIYLSQLVRGSFFVFLAGNFAGLGNFFYNLAMGRMLSPAAYGELEAVLSLSVFFAVPLSVLSIFVVKIVSSYWGRKKKEEVRYFLTSYRQKLFAIGLAGSVFLLLFSPVLVRFLNLSSVLSVVFLSFYFLLGGLSTVNNGGLQGTLSFGFLAANGIVGTAVKLLVSVALVFINFQLSGALFGPFLGSLIGFSFSVLELKHIFKGVASTKTGISATVIKEAFFPTLFASLALTVFMTMDVILARHFFSRSVSGEYAAISVLGKIIYYAVGPVISVMFPLISSRAGNGTPYLLPLLGSLAMVTGVGSLISFVFFMFPNFIVGLLFAGKYTDVASFLGPYSFYMVLFSINSLLTYFLLSVSYFRPMLLLFCLSLFSGILMILFHGSISQLIWINILVSLLYFLITSWLVSLKFISKRFDVGI